MSMQSAIKTGRPRNQAKSTHSRSYPRGVGIDFRKLAGLTLMSYIDHHGTCCQTSLFFLNAIVYVVISVALCGFVTLFRTRHISCRAHFIDFNTGASVVSVGKFPDDHLPSHICNATF